MRRRAIRIAEIGFFVFLGILTLLMTEAAYRIYLRHELYASMAPKLKDDPAPSFHVWAYPAPWRFDRSLGFNFNDGPWLGGIIADGAFSGCMTTMSGNRYGNFAAAWGDYETAQVKVLFFGSSYTLRDVKGDGRTTTNLLQAALSRELGKTVHILNYSRDSIGILSMVDMARARLPVDKPDLIVFAVNTLSLAYQRNWRFIKESGPGTWRMYQALDPTDEITPQRTIVNALVVSNKVTKEWCDRLEAIKAGDGDKSALRTDPLVVDFVREYNAIRRQQNTPEIALDFLSPRVSFVWNKLRHGNAHYGLQVFRPQTIYAPIAIDSYAEDPQFVAAIDAIKQSGVPFRLIHLPALADLRRPGSIVYGVSGVPATQERSLIRSLEQLTGQSYMPLSRYYAPEELSDPLALVEGEADSHPNERGTHVMAQALLRYFRAHPIGK